jgi:malonate transporter MadL subunit
MPIYGTALLALCLLTGLGFGRWLGVFLGVEADIGGVGMAMLLLILGSSELERRGLMKPPTQTGIAFWGQMYVPIVVAMAANQNVRAAVGGGIMAATAGLVGVALCFGLVGLFTRLGNKE